MAPSMGLNLRVTGYCNQGGRKYMEDVFSVAYQQTEDEKDLEYAFFGIFDGHGGREAAVFAKEHLMDFIVKQKGFWADDDQSVLRAIHEGFIQTHQAMWKELEKWPKTVSGLPSTAGTTASIAFIRRGKIYVGHVGDSAIVLGAQDPSQPNAWHGEPLTRDHKPESDEESRRIQESGGKVICKSGVPRVVWNRPKMGHKGPVRRSTHIDEIPFLAVARSLGDLWSYNSKEDVFVVSPEPDTYVYPIDISRHRCLILGTDGAWNMLTPEQAVSYVCQAEKSNEQNMLYPQGGSKQWINPSKYLVDCAIDRWTGNNLRADNTSVVTVMLDPPGPPRAQVLKRQRSLLHPQPPLSTTCDATSTPPALPPRSTKLPLPQLQSKPVPNGSVNDGMLSAKSKASLARIASEPKKDDIQCNEVSSTDTPPLPPPKRKVLKESRLSRELSALQLSTPPPSTSSQRRHHKAGDDSASDTENEEHVINRPRTLRSATHQQQRQIEDVELQFKRLNSKMRSIEKRLAKKTEELSQEVKSVQSKIAETNHNLRSSSRLRPRATLLTPAKPPKPATTSSSGRKRKLPLEANVEPAKSPRTIGVSASAILRKPVSTRKARRTKVVPLKK